MKIVKFLAIATLMIAPLLATRAPAFAQSPAAASSPAMPALVSPRSSGGLAILSSATRGSSWVGAIR